MEEQKTKEVKMNQEKPEKLSYDELNQACAEMAQQLQNQNGYIQKLHKQIQEMGYALQARRMDYLFKTVELFYSIDIKSEKPKFSWEFVQKCIKEIEDSMTIPPEEEETKEN